MYICQQSKERSTDLETSYSILDFLISLCSVGLMIMGLVVSVCTVLSFIINILNFLKLINQGRTEKIFYHMLFLLPFACIFKLSPASSSLFTYIELLVVALLVVKYPNIPKIFMAIWLIYVLYVFFSCDMNLTMAIKQWITPLLIFYFFNYSRCHLKSITLSLTLGLLTSSIVGMFYESFPVLQNYIELDKAYEVEEKVIRFSALYNDPNYYSAIMILAFACLLILYLTKELKISSLVLCACIIGFGAKTVSKSFLLMLVCVGLTFIVMVFLRERWKTGIFLICVVAVFIILVINGRVTMFDNVLERLESSQGTQEKLTTGRSDLWNEYVEYLVDNPDKLLIGKGLNSPVLSSHYPHNTYLDFMYFYGFFGTFLYICVICVACNNGEQNRKRIENFIPIGCMAVMMMFISSLQSFDFGFILMIVLFVLKLNISKK